MLVLWDSDGFTSMSLQHFSPNEEQTWISVFGGFCLYSGP